MQCEFYRAQRSVLIAWCSDAANLHQYSEAASAECEQLADISLLKHLRQLAAIARDLQINGVEHLIDEQRGAVDALFTDMVACATYAGESTIPVEADGQGELPLDVQERGLLGADEGLNMAMLFVIDEGRIAICRNREADHQARHPHDKSH